MTESAVTNRVKASQSRLVRCCDNAAEVLILALLVWLPLAFGGVLPISHAIVVGIAALTALLLSIKCTVGRMPLQWSLVYIPVFAFVALVAIQALPLPFGVLSVMSPAAAEQWRMMLSEPPLSGGFPASLPMTLYPGGTTQDLALLSAGALLLVSVVNLYHDGKRIERLLGCTAIIGGGVAVLGLMQTLSGADAIYGVVPHPSGNATAGPFVHYSHFAQFLNLSIGMALALLVLRMSHRTGRLQHSAESVFDDLRMPGRSNDWLLVVMIVLSMLAIAVSQSRNGLLSMAVGGIVVATLLHRTRILRGTGWLLALVLVGAVVSLMFLGADPVFDRMATLEDPVAALSSRLALIRDSMSVVAEYPFLGIGQGAFEYVFPQFDTSMRPGRAQHAENFYVELLVETGAVGITLFLALVVVVGMAWRRRLRRQRRPVDAAIAGLLFGIAAVMFHAGTDFGLRVPAVAALVVVIVGLVASRSSKAMVVGGGDSDAKRDLRPTRRGLVMAAGLGFGGVVFGAMQLPTIIGAYHADHHFRAAKALQPEIDEAGLAREQELYRVQKEHLDQAVALQPLNVEYRLKQAWFPWEQMLGALTTDRPDDTPWTEEERVKMRAAAREAQRLAMEARRVAPTSGLLWTLAGQLGQQWLEQPNAGAWIVRGMEMSPESPEACLAAGRQLLEQGDIDAAAVALRRAIHMGIPSDRVLEGLIVDAGRADVAAVVADGDVRLLVRLLAIIRRLERSEETQPEGLEAVTPAVRQQAVELLVREVANEEPPSWMLERLAWLHAEDQQDTKAVALYRRFLAARPDSTARYQLAVILERQEEIDAAISELRRLLIYRPGYGPAQQRLKKLRER